MTLQSSGQIDIRDINVELQRSASTRFDINSGLPRELAKKITPQTEISFRDFWGKSYVTQEMVVDTFNTYRSSFFDWVHGGSGDTRFVNNPYSRFLTTTSWTKSFSLSSIPLPDTNWTTIVVSISGSSPVFSSFLINGGDYPIISQTEIFNKNEQRQRVLYVNTSYKNITSVRVAWGRVGANSGSWASIAVIPGRWTGYLHTLRGERDGLAIIYKDNIDIGTYYGGPNGAMTFVKPSTTNTPPSSMQRFDAWWYNNGGFFTATNNATDYQYYDVVCGNTGTVNAVSYRIMSEP